MKQMEHSLVKNPNWYEANQLAILQNKCGQGFELGTTKNNLQSGWDLNLGPPNYKSSALSTRPRCLLTLTLIVVYTEVFQTSVTITNSPINSQDHLPRKSYSTTCNMHAFFLFFSISRFCCDSCNYKLYKY